MGKFTASKLVSIARAELGYKEKASNSKLDSKTANAGHNNYQKFGRDLNKAGYYNGNKNGYEWCDQFVDWCFLQLTGNKKEAEYLECQTGPYGAGCGWSMSYYQNAGRFSHTPKVGDQIFFNYEGDGQGADHTGIVSEVHGSYIITIEGNSGDKVSECKYPIGHWTIAGYGHPRYDVTAASTVKNTSTNVKQAAAKITSSGDANIKKFQVWLNKNYKGSLNGDGKFGQYTKKAAVKALQTYANNNRKAGLVIDGIFGPATKKAAGKLNIKQGDAGHLVYIAQGLLYCYKYNPKGFDGKFGPGMDAAVRKFQKAKGLTADGIIGSNTWAKLLG